MLIFAVGVVMVFIIITSVIIFFTLVVIFIVASVNGELCNFGLVPGFVCRFVNFFLFHGGGKEDWIPALFDQIVSPLRPLTRRPQKHPLPAIARSASWMLVAKACVRPWKQTMTWS